MLARPTKENEDEANERRYRECERSEYACYTACLHHLCNLVFRPLVMISGNECWKREWWIQEKPEEEEAGPDGFNLCSRIRPSALNMKD